MCVNTWVCGCVSGQGRDMGEQKRRAAVALFMDLLLRYDLRRHLIWDIGCRMMDLLPAMDLHLRSDLLKRRRRELS